MKRPDENPVGSAQVARDRLEQDRTPREQKNNDMVTYGTLQFTDPVPLAPEVLPSVAGVFAVVVPNYEYRPVPWEPIYFGQSPNLRGAVGTHHAAYGRWRWHPRGRSGLYVAYAAMPSSTEDWRRYNQQQLVKQYNTVCNRDENADAQAQALREIGSSGRFGIGSD